MGARAASDLWQHLERYNETVDDLARNCTGAGISGSGRLSDPFREMCRIADLLDHTASGREESVHLRQEYCRITYKLEETVSRMGSASRDHLLCDLREHVHAYQAAVCRHHLGQDEPDIAEILSMRDVIGVLCRLLRDKTDLSGIEMIVAMADANLIPDESGRLSSSTLPSGCSPAGRQYPSEQVGSQRRVSPFLQ